MYNRNELASVVTALGKITKGLEDLNRTIQKQTKVQEAVLDELKKDQYRQVDLSGEIEGEQNG